MASKRLNNKIALITGSSRGIGAEIAKRYAAEGAHIISVARTIGALEELDDEIKKISGNSSTIVPFDIKDFNKIDELGGIIAQKFGKIDIFIGNAAILGTLGPVSHVTPKVWDNVFAINVTANYRFIRSLEPLLKQSEAGRAIFLTSESANYPEAFWGPYSASKAALEAMVLCYSKEIENSTIKVNLVDPGTIWTKMLAEALPGRNEKEFKKPSEITDIFVDLACSNSIYNGKVFKAQEF